MSDNDTFRELGFYGKLPTYGDFIQKRLPTDFINPWHEWLQAGMMANRESDPEGWLPSYLNCPAWCFALDGSLCGEQPVAGVTIPSVDKVGRYFNFTMASILPPGTDPATLAFSRPEWFEGLESLALSALDQEMMQDEIEEAINKEAAELSWGPATRPLIESGADFTRVISQDPGSIRDLLPLLIQQLIGGAGEPYGLWWHLGSSQVSPQLVTCTSMPSGEIYLRLIKDEDMIAAASEQAPEIDYMDELLSS